MHTGNQGWVLMILIFGFGCYFEQTESTGLQILQGFVWEWDLKKLDVSLHVQLNV